MSRGWDALKTTASTKWGSIRETVSKKAGEMRDSVRTRMRNIKETVTTAWEDIRTKTSNKIASIKTGVEKGFATVKDKVKTAFGGVYNAITSPFLNAWNSIKTIVSNVKNAFRGAKISFPSIKLPHFTVTWTKYGDLLKLPRVSVSWYKKAYDNPMMFTRPTVLQTPYGPKGFGDGAGNEVVLGMKKLQELVGGTGDVNSVINIYPTAGQNPKQIAAEVQKVLVNLQEQKQAACV